MTGQDTLYVMNPNSSRTVTGGIEGAMAPLRQLGVRIECTTLDAGPPGIETQAQADQVVPHLLAQALDLRPRAAGFVIACFGDPGLHALRDLVDVPVLGIQECAVLSAMTLGQRFGVISILPASVPRHMRAFGAMGVLQRCAGDRPLGLGVGELASRDATLDRMIETGALLRDLDGADVLIMGCAGMADYRGALETALDLPVVEPCQAAAAMAIGRIALTSYKENGS
jgi:Asp/Glu/hydantoin racemase